MSKVTKKILNDTMTSASDIGYSSKGKHFIFKRGYFYRHGMTAQIFRDNVVAELTDLGYEVKVISNDDFMNSWPRDSWFEVRAEVK